MEHVAAIMMLVGCGAANTDCREIAAPSIGFETVEECQALLKPALESLDGRFRVNYGKCATIDPALFLEDLTITWDVTPSGELNVVIDDDAADAPVLVAEKGSRLTVSSN
jgi:hypothetical protein